ncbi:hypothetical protein [Bacteroides propionicifaciens]|uniref:hypothetical protein n=1 Tax=Bacteroides propionicifaciens TaxID=392838 RepID=UPI00035E02A2|nr:hypothetical protein [Bacteroides propionicifaciens]
MTENKDILQTWKERIINESKRGDRIKACRNAGFTYTTHQFAMKKATLADLTDGELSVLAANIQILDNRKEKLREYAEN